jgi:hypothetical protein
MPRIDSKTKVDLLHIVLQRNILRKNQKAKKETQKKKKPAESPSFGSSWIGRHSKNGFSPSSSSSSSSGREKKKENSRIRKMKMEKESRSGSRRKPENAGYPAVSTTF